MIATRRDDSLRITTPDPDALADMVRRLGRPRILVVGDVMLDQYVSCNAERLSQEAPVPLLRANLVRERAGGAANVALTLAKLGADVTMAGVVGCDRAGERLRRRLTLSGISDASIVVDPTRPTTRKRRYVATNGNLPQQVVRVDVESREPLAGSARSRLLGAMEVPLRSCDIVLISDYDKGVCTTPIIRRIIDRSRLTRRRIVVDPPRLADFKRYRGVHCLTPNRLEAGLASGIDVDGIERAFEAGEELRRQAEAEAMLVTLDEQGMALIRPDGQREHYSSTAREVCDTTGAGDAVLSVFGLCLASGVEYGTAAALGNLAGGVKVGRWGVSPLKREDLLAELNGLSRKSLK